MSRTTNWLTGMLLAFAPLAVGQQSQPAPQLQEDALASQQLIAWSWLQKPQPTPQPLPPRDAPLPPADNQGPQAKLPANPDGQQTPTQSFTGRIVKDGEKFVLKAASNTTYQLDQQGVSKYENQDVRIVGSLDSGSNTIRVVKIELLS